MKFKPLLRPVKAIAAQDGDPKRWTKRLIFYDDDGEKISQWPKEHDGISSLKMHQLDENADLIGVYGVKGLDDCLSSFGFIVKVKHQW